jgi:cytoskeletal protein CcmA (bactofilin family)
MFTKRGTSGTSDNSSDPLGEPRSSRAAVPPASGAGAAPLPPRQPAPPQPAPRADAPPRRAPEPPQPPSAAAPASAMAAESSRRPASEQGTLIVGRDIAMAGEIRACDRLIVEGTVEAALNDCRVLEVSESGLFRGTAEVDTADISGNVDGELIVQGRLIIRSTGQIVGSLRYGEMEIERGGQIVGYTELVNEPGSAEKAVSASKPAKAKKESAKG